MSVGPATLTPSRRSAQSLRRNAEDAEKIGARARRLREAAGRLTGHASGANAAAESPSGHEAKDTLLEDVHDAFGNDEKTWSANLVARLADRFPEKYARWDARRLGVALRPYGITTAQVWAEPDSGGEPGNRYGLTRRAVADALRQRDHGGSEHAPDDRAP